jgi:hypothetical protein
MCRMSASLPLGVALSEEGVGLGGLGEGVSLDGKRGKFSALRIHAHAVPPAAEHLAYQERTENAHRPEESFQPPEHENADVRRHPRCRSDAPPTAEALRLE